MKNNGFFIAIIFASGMLVMRGLSYDEPKEETSKGGSKRTITGAILKPIELDSVTYDQHPQKKCWHLHYENY